MESRALTPFERMIDITDELHSFNAVIVLHVEPAPNPARVRNALDSLQQYSPMLQARIIADRRRSFRFDVTSPIPLEIIHGNPKTRWQQVLQKNLNTRLDSRRGPLLRVDLLAAEDCSGASILFTFHHAIMDASSAGLLLHEFLRLLEGEQASDPIPRMPDIVPYFPAPYRGPRRALALPAFMACQMADEFSFLLHSIKHPPLPLQPRGECRVFELQLSVEETRRFVQVVRSAGVTLNSTLNAALGLACQRVLFQNDRRLLRMVTFADLRPYLNPPISPKVLGNAISMLRITQPVDPGMGLWEFAKRIHPAFVDGFRRGDKFAMYLMADRVVQMILGINRVRLGTTAMSYTGPVDFPETGEFRITGVNASIANNRYGPVLSAQARLFRDRLGMDLLYIDTDLTPTQMDDLNSELRRLLTVL